MFKQLELSIAKCSMPGAIYRHVTWRGVYICKRLEIERRAPVTEPVLASSIEMRLINRTDVSFRPDGGGGGCRGFVFECVPAVARVQCCYACYCFRRSVYIYIYIYDGPGIDRASGQFLRLMLQRFARWNIEGKIRTRRNIREESNRAPDPSVAFGLNRPN